MPESCLITDLIVDRDNAAAPVAGILYNGKTCNLFSGVLGNVRQGSSESWCSSTPEHWAEMWRHAGMAPPAPLPAGAVAHFERRSRTGHHLEIALKHYDAAARTMEWQITETPVAGDDRPSGYWVICILPYDRKRDVYHYAKGTAGKKDPAAAAKALQGEQQRRGRMHALARRAGARKFRL